MFDARFLSLCLKPHFENHCFVIAPCRLQCSPCRLVSVVSPPVFPLCFASYQFIMPFESPARNGPDSSFCDSIGADRSMTSLRANSGTARVVSGEGVGSGGVAFRSSFACHTCTASGVRSLVTFLAMRRFSRIGAQRQPRPRARICLLPKTDEPCSVSTRSGEGEQVAPSWPCGLGDGVCTQTRSGSAASKRQEAAMAKSLFGKMSSPLASGNPQAAAADAIPITHMYIRKGHSHLPLFFLDSPIAKDYGTPHLGSFVLGGTFHASLSPLVALVFHSFCTQAYPHTHTHQGSACDR